MSELRALTGVRGLAAWLVVLYHLRGAIAGLPPAAEHVLAKGYLAVDFFFLLSGFVIWLSWGERLRGGGMATAVRFWQKRIARVWPLHLAMLSVAMMLALLYAATGRSDAAFRAQDLPAHLFFGLLAHVHLFGEAYVDQAISTAGAIIARADELGF